MSSLTAANLHSYQKRGIQHLLDHPRAMLWEGMGMGKTVQVLFACLELLDTFACHGVLVIAPRRVCQFVWRQEAKKWSPLSHLTFSLVVGTAEERETALRRHAQIYLINYDNIPWLVSKIKQHWLRHGIHPPFNFLVLDEVTKTKDPTRKRTRSLGEILPCFSRRVGLTGEPSANGYKDLFGQYLCIDDGKRLGTSLTTYRSLFLRPVGYMGRNWEATRSGKQRIHMRISDITLEMSSEDYLSLPEVVYNDIWVELPLKARRIYDSLEKTFFATLDSGSDLEVMNEASKINKLLQVAGGAAYLSVGGPWEKIHASKTEALQDVVEEASGRSLLLGYVYVHQAKTIASTFPETRFLGSDQPESEIQETMRLWESGKLQLLCGHPASMGHGLNLTEGDSDVSAAVWFSLPWSLELYRQFNARIIGGHRRKRGSVIHHILARNTVDELVYATLRQKHQSQEGLKRAVREYREKRGW